MTGCMDDGMPSKVPEGWLWAGTEVTKQACDYEHPVLKNTVARLLDAVTGKGCAEGLKGIQNLQKNPASFGNIGPKPCGTCLSGIGQLFIQNIRI